jgi:omega-6 fatty acid desaturase (delta-12 desaturase)
LHRFPANQPFRWNRDRASILWTNVALVGVYAGLCGLLGWRAFLMVQLPIVVLAASIGTWLFYVQHQFEGTYWAPNARWDYATAALRGSSYYKMPRLLQWFTGNIGFHHIHHLSHRIPNYNLQQCHDENPMFQEGCILTLRSSLRTIPLKLWDEDRERLVDMRQVWAARPSGHSARPPATTAVAWRT